MIREGRRPAVFSLYILILNHPATKPMGTTGGDQGESRGPLRRQEGAGGVAVAALRLLRYRPHPAPSPVRATPPRPPAQLFHRHLRGARGLGPTHLGARGLADAPCDGTKLPDGPIDPGGRGVRQLRQRAPLDAPGAARGLHDGRGGRLGWMDGWMNAWMHGCMDILIDMIEAGGKRPPPTPPNLLVHIHTTPPIHIPNAPHLHSLSSPTTNLRERTTPLVRPTPPTECPARRRCRPVRARWGWSRFSSGRTTRSTGGWVGDCWVASCFIHSRVAHGGGWVGGWVGLIDE
jgi:hypothetical protein